MRKYPLVAALLLITSISPACCAVDAPWQDQIVVPELPSRLTKVIEALILECPLNADAVVVFRKIDANVWGWTWYDARQGVYMIEVDTRQPIHAMLDTLIHEWAHAMIWDASQGAGAPHGPLWGVAWARCYCVLLKIRKAG